MGKHYVPQEYLRGFASDAARTKIWMYDKRRRVWGNPAIQKVAQQRDYFDAETENELNTSIEAPAHAALRRLRETRELAPMDRNDLALYIATMVMRVPSKRAKARAILPESLDRVIDRYRAAIEAVPVTSVRTEELKAERIAEIELLRARYRDDPPPDVLAQMLQPFPSERLIRAVAVMTWRIVRTTGPSFFLTSDKPAVTLFGGFATPGAELTFPLAKDLALLGSRDGEPGATMVYDVPQGLVKEVNRRIAHEATRFVFYHTCARWVGTLADRERPHLNRIRW